MHTNTLTHTCTMANDLLPCVCCLQSCCFFFVSFVRFHCANRLTATCTQTSERVNEPTNELTNGPIHVRMYVCAVCSFYCCQFPCPFHSLVIHINNICALRSKYIIIYIMITFARCWCACAYVCVACVCNDFFLNRLSFSFNSTSIYLSTLPAVLVSLFGIFFSLVQAVYHSIG